MSSIKENLRKFKLSGIYSTLEERLMYAEKNSLPHKEFLEILLEDESNNRRGNNYKKSVFNWTLAIGLPWILERKGSQKGYFVRVI